MDIWAMQLAAWIRSTGPGSICSLRCPNLLELRFPRSIANHLSIRTDVSLAFANCWRVKQYSLQELDGGESRRLPLHSQRQSEPQDKAVASGGTV